MKPLILTLALLLLTPSYLADAGLRGRGRTFPATILVANGNKYIMWGPDDIKFYPGGIKKRRYGK